MPVAMKAGGLAQKGQSLHHWLVSQRAGWVPQGLRNAAFNYLPISANLNSWMNGSTMLRSTVQRGFAGTVIGMYGAVPTQMVSGCCR